MLLPVCSPTPDHFQKDSIDSSVKQTECGIQDSSHDFPDTEILVSTIHELICYHVKAHRTLYDFAEIHRS